MWGWCFRRLTRSKKTGQGDVVVSAEVVVVEL